MWIGNAVHWALKLVMQSLFRDVTMIYRTKLWRLTDYAKKLLETTRLSLLCQIQPVCHLSASSKVSGALNLM